MPITKDVKVQYSSNCTCWDFECIADRREHFWPDINEIQTYNCINLIGGIFCHLASGCVHFKHCFPSARRTCPMPGTRGQSPAVIKLCIFKLLTGWVGSYSQRKSGDFWKLFLHRDRHNVIKLWMAVTENHIHISQQSLAKYISNSSSL